MAAKKNGKRKRVKKQAKVVTPYVAERIAELAPEFGWDAKEVAELVADSSTAVTPRQKKR